MLQQDRGINTMSAALMMACRNIKTKLHEQTSEQRTSAICQFWWTIKRVHTFIYFCFCWPARAKQRFIHWHSIAAMIRSMTEMKSNCKMDDTWIKEERLQRECWTRWGQNRELWSDRPARDSKNRLGDSSRSQHTRSMSGWILGKISIFLEYP